MPRLRQVRRYDAHPFAQTMYGLIFGDKDPIDEPGTTSGTPGNWWTVTALVPDIFDHMVAGFQFYQSDKRELPSELRELAQTRTGFAQGSRFVFSQHCKVCREIGISDEKVNSIPAWTTADCYSPAERAVLAFTDCLVLDRGRVPDETFGAVQAVLSDEAILELSYIVCTYAMHATLSKALRLELDDVDEPVSEQPGGRVSLD